jgi:hypothetical protein
MLLTCLAVAGCTTTTGGSARPAENPWPSTTAPTTTTPALVPAAGISDKLLKRSELASILADTDLKEVKNYNKIDTDTLGFEPPVCAARVLAGNTFAYYGTGRVAVAGDWNRGARNQMASQLITVWENRKEPKTVVAQSGQEWTSCPQGKPFAVKGENNTQTNWVPGPVTTESETRVSSSVQRQELPQRACHHVIASQANIVVETIACGDGDVAAQANEIANRLLAKFPQ